MPISISTFFYWKRKFKHHDKDEQIKDLISYIWNYDNYMGILRITQVIRNEFDVIINHKKVYRLMKIMGIYGRGYHKKIRKYDSSKGPTGKSVKNHIHRRFKAHFPYQKMVTDITEFKVPKTGEKIYLEPIMDLYNNEILSYNITKGSPDLSFVMKPLNKLIQNLPITFYKKFMHTDQGWHYRNHKWQNRLRKFHITPSMSKKASCLDNACIESFFNKLKTETGKLSQYNSSIELINYIEKWINYYNYKRIQIKLDGMSPINYRLHNV